MSCKKNYCPNGLAVCCKDCIRQATNFCKTTCEGAEQEKCKNYYDKEQERMKRKKERNTIRCLPMILVIVLMIFGVALLQEQKTAAPIGDTKKQIANMERDTSKEDIHNLQMDK